MVPLLASRSAHGSQAPGGLASAYAGGQATPCSTATVASLVASAAAALVPTPLAAVVVVPMAAFDGGRAWCCGAGSRRGCSAAKAADRTGEVAGSERADCRTPWGTEGGVEKVPYGR